MDDVCSERYLDSGTLQFVRFKARQIAGSYGFHRDEFEDVQQTLIVECLQRMARFDPCRGNPRSFAQLVINRAIANLIESHTAQCRDHRVCQFSIDAPANCDDPASPALADSISEDDRRQTRSAPRLEICLLKWDLERTIATLSPELQLICHLLMAFDRITEVAKAAGISRATLHRRMRVIQNSFTRAHLYNYLR